MSINNCDIDFKTCEKSKKYKRADIDEIARKCDINPDEYKNRKTLCEAIVAKKSKGDIPTPKNTKTVPVKDPKDNCDIPQNICEKSKKYNREDINSIAKNCGIDDPTKFKSRKALCMAILEKRGIKPKEEEPKKEPVKTISPKCDKKTLENCSLKDLQSIAKEENIKNYSGKKKDELIKYIKEIRQKRKDIKIVSSDDEEEEPKIPMEVPSDEEEIPIKPKKQSPQISKDCDKITLENCKSKDLQIIAKEENMKNYSKYKKDELVNFIKKVRKNRKGIIIEEEEEDEEEEDEPLLPLTKKILKKIIKIELKKLGTFDAIKKRFDDKFGKIRKYIIEEAKKEYRYDLKDEILKELGYKDILKSTIKDMYEDEDEEEEQEDDDDEPINIDKIKEQREQKEREIREQKEREMREQKEKEMRGKKVIFKSPIESEREYSKRSIEEDEDLFMDDLHIDVVQMDISQYILDYMNNNLVNMNKEDLIKIYQHILDTKFNPNRNSDIKEIIKTKSEIIKDIIDYIQLLSDSFFNLYKSIGDKRYQSNKQTDELAIKKYAIYDIQDLINTLYKRYSKNIVNNFEVKMLKFFLRPWQKVNDFITHKAEFPKVEFPKYDFPKAEFPKGDIEDVLDKLQKSPEKYKECNPYEEKFCENGNYCDITTTPGKCISKDIAEKSEMKKINYKGYNIIGDQISIDKLYEFGVPLIDVDVTPIKAQSPKYIPKIEDTIDFTEIYKKGDKIQILKTKEYGEILDIFTKPDGKNDILVRILPEGTEKIFNYDEISSVDYIEEDEELPVEKEIIEDLEEKESERLRKIEAERNERDRKIREEMEEIERNRKEKLRKEEEERIKKEKIEEERMKKEKIEEERMKKDKIRYENIDTLLSEISKRSIEDIDDIDIVNNQVLKCLGLVA
jgi:hypothetical protein